ncbi:MAG: hypothetical protein HRT44_12615 [Bdellovibrionales bacterium]|nr:hypothetical protein [Bdellovibrionales bacterium]
MQTAVLCNDNGTVEACMNDEDLAGKRPSNENIRWFFPNDMSYTKDIRQMEVSAAIEEEVQPWSDDYWAIQGGVLGHRYTDYEASGYSWDESLNYVLSQEGHISKILNMPEGDEKKNAIDRLSPSEKYDLLISTKDDILNPSWLQWTDAVEYSNGMRLFGQVGGFLTPQQWAQGQPYFDRDGSVESWMGICHGWAAAAIQMPRPKNAITLMAADGKTEVTFYPAEIKSFGSYLWANSAPRNSRFIGGRCNDKEVEYDDESGAVIDETCFDTNPADWHAIVSAYLGRHKQSFVMDMTFDYEVWNQPVLSYDVHFSNPMSDTWETSENVMDMVVPYDEAFKAQDAFKNIRNASNKTRYIVNVGMEVKYLSENSPEARGTDGPQYDNIVETYYSYDLELDANYNDIGGEWHSNEHPDFLWTYDKGQKAYAALESQYSEESVLANINTTNSAQPFLSPALQQLAQDSAKNGEIWGAFVRAMFEMANQ